MIDKNETNTNKEIDSTSKSELSDLLCELNKTIESFGADYDYAVRIESQSVGFLKGKIQGAQHIAAILKHYISTIT